MWVLKNIKTGEIFHMLMDKKTYIISRNIESGDLILSGDNSISRQHAHLSPAKDHVVLIDSGSKYGTFVNKMIDANKAIPKNQEINLSFGDLVRFGRLENTWKLEKIELFVMSSSLTQPEKVSLQKGIAILNGDLLDSWSDKCTHLTINNLTATVKVIQALAFGIPIVNLKFWIDYVKAIKTKTSAPKPKNYKPTIVEQFGNDWSLDVNVERKRLFADKVFIFMVKKHMDNFRQIILLAGGTCCSIEEKRLRKTSLVKANTIVIHYSPSTESMESQASTEMSGVYEYIESKGKRSIPDCEIGLAILHCSTQKFCNPNFKFADNFQISELLVTKPSIILAEMTPSSETKSPTKDNVPNIEVPETVHSIELIESEAEGNVQFDDSKDTVPFVYHAPIAVDQSFLGDEKKRKHTPDKEDNKPLKRIALDPDPNLQENEILNRPNTSKGLFKVATRSNVSKVQSKISDRSSTSKASFSANQNMDNDWLCSQNIVGFKVPEIPINQSAAQTTTQANQSKETTKRGFAMLMNNDSDNDDDDHLFSFGGDDPIAKRSKPSDLESDPFDFLPSYTTQREDRNSSESQSTSSFRKPNEILQRSTNPRETSRSMAFITTMVPVTIAEDGWLSCSLMTTLKIEENTPIESTIQIKTDDDDENKDQTLKWINSIRNGFGVETMNDIIKLNDQSTLRETNVSHDSGRTNFKAFKKFYNRSQSIILKTFPTTSQRT